MAAGTLTVATAQAADGQVAVGVDDSPGGLAALRWAMRYAQARRKRLVAVRAWAAGGPPGLPVTIETPQGNPGHALTRMAPAGDNVIVAGTTSGHHLQRAMHGSVGGYCATHAACPVVFVPGGQSRRVGG
jgi:universal stress protein family protein